MIIIGAIGVGAILEHAAEQFNRCLELCAVAYPVMIGTDGHGNTVAMCDGNWCAHVTAASMGMGIMWRDAVGDAMKVWHLIIAMSHERAEMDATERLATLPEYIRHLLAYAETFEAIARAVPPRRMYVV
ncbi:hypothetical protein ACWEN6_13690 [Sphaerisporangium sp. NPDC004334]